MEVGRERFAGLRDLIVVVVVVNIEKIITKIKAKKCSCNIMMTYMCITYGAFVSRRRIRNPAPVHRLHQPARLPPAGQGLHVHTGQAALPRSRSRRGAGLARGPARGGAGPCRGCGRGAVRGGKRPATQNGVAAFHQLRHLSVPARPWRSHRSQGGGDVCWNKKI